MKPDGADPLQLPDLASRALRGSVIAASDEFFAEKENLINPGAPAFTPHTFGHKGQLYDGWETRRRRGRSADSGLLTRTLREELGFDGVVVSDYFGIAFLHKLHRVAGSPADAGALALAAGIDVELPHVHCYGPALAGAVRAGQVPETLVDREIGRASCRERVFNWV